MKICAWCNNPFESGSKKARFCSTSHRVMFNRKYGKKETKPVFDVIRINSALKELNEKMDRIILYAPPKEAYDSPKPDLKTLNDEPLSFANLKAKNKPSARSFEEYEQLIIECQTQEDYLPLKREIENDENLTSKQKILLLRKN